MKKQLRTELITLYWLQISKKEEKEAQEFQFASKKKLTCTMWLFNRGKKRSETSRKRKLSASPINVTPCNFQRGLSLNGLIEEFIQAWTTEAGSRKSGLKLRTGVILVTSSHPALINIIDWHQLLSKEWSHLSFLLGHIMRDVRRTAHQPWQKNMLCIFSALSFQLIITKAPYVGVSHEGE